MNQQTPGNYQQAVPMHRSIVQTCVTQRPAWMSVVYLLCVLIRDVSTSMAGMRAKEATQASIALAHEVAMPVNQHRIDGAIIDFSDSATLVCPPTPATELVGKIKPMHAGGYTNMHHGLELALPLVQAHHGPRKPSVVVLYSDGEFNTGGDPTPVADQLRQAGATLITVAYGDDAGYDTLRAIATSPNHCYRRAIGNDALRQFMADLGKTLTHTLTTGGDYAQTLATLRNH
ncbi:MAG: VWA domain-containing protein [Phycisphaeraceae bacterium]|nr:VWA domain-containing protein [Phycisphaeraceae bacterium]